MDKLQVFTKEVNPLDKNLICIYEKRAVKKHLIFMINLDNFESEHSFLNIVDFVLSSLNKNI